MRPVVFGERWNGYLRDLMVDEVEVVRTIQAAPKDPVSGSPDLYYCQCIAAARRPEDPETAELLRLRLTVRSNAPAWVVERIEVLEDREVGSCG